MIDFFGEFSFDNDFVGGGVAGFNLDAAIADSDEDLKPGSEAVSESKTVSANEIVMKGLSSEDDAEAGAVYNGTADNPVITDHSDLDNVSIVGMVVKKNSAGTVFFQLALDAITALTFNGAAELTLSNDVQLGSSGAKVNFVMNNGKPESGTFSGGGAFSFFFGSAANQDVLYDVLANGTTVEANVDGSFTVDTKGKLETLTVTEKESQSVVINVTNAFNYVFTIEDTNGVEISETINIRNVDDGKYTITSTVTNDGRETELDLSALKATGDDPINIVGAGGADVLILPTTDTTDTTPTEIRIAGVNYTYVNRSTNAAFILNDSGSVTGFRFGGTSDSITVPNGTTSFTSFRDEDGTTLGFSSHIVNESTQGYTITRQSDTTYRVELSGSATVSDGNTTLEFDTAKRILDNPVTVYFDDLGNILSVDGLDNLGESDTMTVTDTSTITATNQGLAIGKPDNPTGYISVGTGDFIYKNNVVAVTSGDTIYSLNGYDLATVNGSTATSTITDPVSGLTYTHKGDGHFIFNEDDGITGFVFASKNDYITVPNGSGIDLFYLDETTAVNVPTITGDSTGYTITLSDATDPKFEISGLDTGAIFPKAAPFAEEIVSEDADNVITINLDGEITAIDNFTTDGIKLEIGTYEIAINGSQLNYSSDHVLTAVADGNKLVSVNGLYEGDVIIAGTDTGVIFQFNTDANGDGEFLVNGKLYTVENDSNHVVYITGGGVVTDLDEDASLAVSEGPVTVNGKEYSASKIAAAGDNPEIIGYTTKGGNLTSFITEDAHPLVHKGSTVADISDMLNLPAYGDQVFNESDGATLDQASNSNRVRVNLDDEGTATATFNNNGKNLAVVTGDGQKNIDLGDGGDAVIVTEDAGDTSNSLVSIVGGTGSDSVVVQGPVPVYFDMADGGADKLITYAAANGRITLDHYDETSGAGIAIHDPQIESVKDLSSAIDEGMLLFQDGRILSIDRDEAADGTDRITDIRVNNKNSNHQTMVRLFGYKDNSDSYGDDDGQLVGFTGKEGGILDASDIDEEMILVGNKNGDHTVGSALITGVGNDTVYAGAGDTVNAGAGSNQIRLTNDSTRQAATVVIGQGLNTITGLQTGFNGDVLDISAVSSLGTIEYEDGLLTIADETTKSTTAAAVNTEADYIAQTFINDNTVMKAAIAKDGGTIDVTDTNAPNYFVAEDGAINFAQYSGEVNVDVDGDWVGTSVGGESATLLSGFSSLVGGSGNTLFKGGEHNEVLIAGTGESSLYGAGGRNVLVGSTGTNKFGSTEFFVQGIKNGAQNTITNFEFIEDNGSNTATFDNLNLGMADNNDVTDIQVNSDGSVSLAVKGSESQATEKVTIEGAAGKEFLVDRGTTSESVVQIVSSVNTVDNSYVDFYTATQKNATVQIGDVTAAKVWLEAPDFSDGVEFVGDYTVIDARGSNAQVEMAGNNVSNTIYGGLGNASMWGGAGNANDVMYGGSAHNEFYYEVGNGNDTIMSANSGDIIHLGATLDQVDFDRTNISASGIEVTFNDGGKLNINSSADVTFSFDDGTAVKANRQTNQFE